MLSHVSKGDLSGITIMERATLIIIMIFYYYSFALIMGDIVAIVSELIPTNLIKENDQYF